MNVESTSDANGVTATTHVPGAGPRSSATMWTVLGFWSVARAEAVTPMIAATTLSSDKPQFSIFSFIYSLFGFGAGSWRGLLE